MKKIGLRACFLLFFIMYCSSLCAMKENKKKYLPVLLYPPARVLFFILHPYKKNYKEKDIRIFEEKLYTYDESNYPSWEKNLHSFERSFGDQKKIQTLLAKADVPTLRFHGAAFFEAFRQDKKNEEAFCWAYFYLYKASEKDPFSQELFARLLQMKSMSPSALYFYKNYVDHSQAQLYFIRAAVQRTFFNVFTNKFENLLYTPGTVWKILSDEQCLQIQQPGTWCFSSVPVQEHRIVATSFNVHNGPWCVSSYSNTSDTSTVFKKKPPKVPAKDNKAVQRILYKRAHIGDDYALQLLEKISDNEKTLPCLLLLAKTYVSDRSTLKPSLERIQQIAFLIMKQCKLENPEHARNKSFDAVLKDLLPLAEKSEALRMVCFNIIKYGCKKVYKEYKNIFHESTYDSADFISNHDDKEKSAEVFLLQAENAFYKNNYNDVQRYLMQALNLAHEKNKPFIKQSVVASLRALEEKNVELLSLYSELVKHKIYDIGVTKNQIDFFLKNLNQNIGGKKAATLTKHPLFKEFEESDDTATQYLVMRWLMKYQGYIKESSSRINELFYALKKRNFLPVKICALAEDLNQKKDIHVHDLIDMQKDIFSLYTSSQEFFNLFPECKEQVKKCIVALASYANHSMLAAYYYADIVRYKKFSFGEHDPEKALLYYKKSLDLGLDGDLKAKALKEIEEYGAKIDPLSKLESFVDNTHFLMKYFLAHSQEEKALCYALKLASIPFDKKKLKAKISFFVENKECLELIKTAAEKGNVEAALCYSRFIRRAFKYGLSLSSEKNNCKFFLFERCKEVYNDCLLVCLENNTANMELEDEIGEMCYDIGAWCLEANQKPAARDFFQKGALSNNLECAYAFASLLLSNPTSSEDIQEGFKWLCMTVQKKHKDALAMYGEICLYGLQYKNQVSKDFLFRPQEGYKALEEAFLLGSKKAEALLKIVPKPFFQYLKPLTTQDPYVCYEYAQFLCDNHKYDEALVWLEYAHDIPQASFYKALCLFSKLRVQSTQEELDEVCMHLDNALKKLGEMKDLSEKKRYIGLCLQQLKVLNDVSSCFSATLIAFNHLVSFKEILGQEEVCSVAFSFSKRILNAFGENKSNELKNFLNNTVPLLEKIAINAHDESLSLGILLFHIKSYKNNLFYSSKIDQIVRAKKFILFVWSILKSEKYSEMIKNFYKDLDRDLEKNIMGDSYEETMKNIYFLKENGFAALSEKLLRKHNSSAEQIDVVGSKN